MWIDDALTPIHDGVAYVSPAGVTYAANVPRDQIPGLRAVTTTEPPNAAGMVVTGWHIEDVGGQPTQVWDSRGESAGEAKNRIISALAALDAASSRPLRAIATGSATQADHDRLAELEGLATTLRAELAELTD